MNSIYGNYLSEYNETIIVHPSTFIENNNYGSTPYLLTYEILEYQINKFFVLCTQSETTLGKFGQVDYISGNFRHDNFRYEYFAYYFSSFDKNNLFEICVPTEKDLSKYTFCIKTSICNKNKVPEDFKNIIKYIKNKIVDNL